MLEKRFGLWRYKLKSGCSIILCCRLHQRDCFPRQYRLFELWVTIREMPQTVRQDSTTSNATPHSRLTQRGHVTVAMPQYRDYKRGLMTWLIPIVVLGFLIIFFVVLIVFMPQVIDNYISRSVDERLRLCQRQRLADCPPCRPGDDTSTNTECCELDDDGSSSIQKVGKLSG